MKRNFKLEQRTKRFVARNVSTRKRLGLSSSSTPYRRNPFTTISEIAGAYLIWLYALRPLPHDEQIRSEFTSVINSFNARHGSYLSTRATYTLRVDVDGIEEWWTGTQCLGVKTLPLARVIPANLDEYLDGLGPLSMGSDLKLPRQVSWGDMINRLSAAGIPTDRYSLAKLLLEMYPLSFVANWATGVIGKLEDLHIQELWKQYQIDYVCRSIKAYRSANESFQKFVTLLLSTNASSSCWYRAYVREYSNEIPVLPLRDHSVPLSYWWVQGTALILQRIPRLARLLNNRVTQL